MAWYHDSSDFWAVRRAPGRPLQQRRRVGVVSSMRKCTRRTCAHPAVAALTCDYGNNTVVIGPLPMRREPYATELCEAHVAKFTAPLGWEVIRLASNFEPAPPSPDDILALAEVVREVSNQRVAREAPPTSAHPPSDTWQSPNHPSVLAAQSRAQDHPRIGRHAPATGAARGASAPQWGPFSPDPRPTQRSERGSAGSVSRPASDDIDQDGAGTGECKLRIIDSKY